jgi:hypothetical protein
MAAIWPGQLAKLIAVEQMVNIQAGMAINVFLLNRFRRNKLPGYTRSGYRRRAGGCGSDWKQSARFPALIQWPTYRFHPGSSSVGDVSGS